MNTKLHLFTVKDYASEDAVHIFSKMMQYYGQIKHICCYKFVIPTPVRIEVIKGTETETTKKFFSGKTVTFEREHFSYYLVFEAELTEQELNMWRMFKLGWRSRTPFRSFDF